MSDIDYGPLTQLIGTWHGDDGMDIAPEDDGAEKNPYHELMEFEPIGDVTNAGEETLVGLRYHQSVRHINSNQVFHDETGYVLWDAANERVILSFSIPRAVNVLASGCIEYKDGVTVMSVSADAEDACWSIQESPFMREKASTKSFTRCLEVEGNRLTYKQTTMLNIYGKEFEHTDGNSLLKIRD